MGKTRDVFKKTKVTKGNFHAKVGKIRRTVINTQCKDSELCFWFDPGVTGPLLSQILLTVKKDAKEVELTAPKRK